MTEALIMLATTCIGVVIMYYGITITIGSEEINGSFFFVFEIKPLRRFFKKEEEENEPYPPKKGFRVPFKCDVCSTSYVKVMQPEQPKVSKCPNCGRVNEA